MSESLSAWLFKAKLHSKKQFYTTTGWIMIDCGGKGLSIGGCIVLVDFKAEFKLIKIMVHDVPDVKTCSTVTSMVNYF